jgi:hypothetical protein
MAHLFMVVDKASPHTPVPALHTLPPLPRKDATLKLKEKASSMTIFHGMFAPLHKIMRGTGCTSTKSKWRSSTTAC